MSNRKQRRAEKSKTSSLAGNQGPLQGLFQEALQYHQAGMLAEAEQRYRQILSLDPQHADSLHLLGVLAHSVGAHDVAIGLIRQAITVKDNVPFFHSNLGNVYKDQEKYDEAISCYKRAVSLEPDFPEALASLGLVYKNTEDFKLAIEYCERALYFKPDFIEALNNLANAWQALGEFEKAIPPLKKAVELKPDYAVAHINLGNIYKQLGRHNEALSQYELAMPYSSGSADFFNKVGDTYSALGYTEEAEKFFKRALEIQPDYREAQHNLAVTLLIQGKIDEAISVLSLVLKDHPDSVDILNLMGSAHKDQGKLMEAINFYRRAIALEPHPQELYNNLLLAMVYAAEVSAEEMAEASREFGERVADPMIRDWRYDQGTDPERRLKIGYISPDFREHAVNYFFEPLLRHHDHAGFDVYAYSNSFIEDHVTERLKGEFDHWYNIKSLSDDKAAELIHEHQIDILIDLAGHTGYNRLMVFARKPAPVQVTWLGHPATSGMKAMDYRITDPYAEPPGMTEHLNVETLWRLPDFFCCYQAHENSPEVIDHPPFEDNGYITFGCFNNFSKVTDDTLRAWNRILEQVPGSKLLLEIRGLENPKFKTELIERFTSLGLPMDRLILEPRKKANQFVLYNKLDIVLDPFPCNGGTTSMDALWMGVPMITLAGRHFVSRLGVTVLSNAGLPELIAQDVDAYVDLAVHLATDRDRLRTVRHGLRDRVRKSPLMDQEAFARNMENAYREMWRIWCAKQSEVK